jgi:uncharacterized membrane protein YgcG
MPLAPTSYIRLDYKADRAEALYSDAHQTIEAAINAPEEQLPQCSGSSADGRQRPAAPIDIPSLLEPVSMDLGTGSYREGGGGGGGFSGTPRSGRTPRGTPRTPRTSAKAHHQHTNSGGSIGGGGGSKPKGLGRNSSRKR